ncbi:MAG: hypothetical protein Kow0077_12520 [Anaerolineae bacterium]
MRSLPRLSFIVLVVLILVLALPVMAATVSKSGTLTANTFQSPEDPFFSYMGPCTSGLKPDTNYTYDTIPFSVDASGTYTMSVTAAAFDSFLVLYRAPFNPASPLTNCLLLNDDTNGLLAEISGTLTGGTDYVLVVTSFVPGASGSYTVEFSGPGNFCFPSCASSVAGIIDGRINAYDIAAPVAVYPAHYADGTGLHFYAIDDAGEGDLVLEVTPATIAAVPELPAQNTLIASTPDGSIALYRLTTGEFQVNAGSYVIVFSQLYSGAPYYHP